MKVSVVNYALRDRDLLLKKWEDLHLKSINNPFLDKRWIDTWLSYDGLSVLVIEAMNDKGTIGLTLISKKIGRRLFNLMALNQLWLHRVGNEKSDQIWIEHNDFLLDKEYADEARQAMLDYLKKSSITWHELYVGMSPMSTINNFSKTLGNYRTIVSAPDYSVDLTNINNVDDYLAVLSKNTRSQIRRTLKLLKQEGSVELVRAESYSQKEDFFAQMSQLHQKKWRQTKEGSGFDNPQFVAFHKKLIFDDVKNIYTALYSLSIGGRALAFIYILQSENTWSFYLSGIETHSSNKIKVGLLAHTLVIEQAIKNNIKKYAFLAGEARYKQSLSNVKEEDQALVCFSQGSILLKFIQQLRVIKQFILSR